MGLPGKGRVVGVSVPYTDAVVAKTPQEFV
jgi:hypothetical protein